MADKKISALTGASTPLAGTEVLPIVQGGATVKVAVSDLTVGRAVSATTFIPSGSVAPTNGMYLPAANTIGITNNSVERMRVGTTSGVATVGIGTTTSTASLQINDFGAGGYNGRALNVNGESALFDGAGQFDMIIGDGGVAYMAIQTTNDAVSMKIRDHSGAADLVTVVRASGDTTINKGNLIPGTAAKGINFTANTPAAGMTSQLLNWYEEGTWTPNQGSGLTVIGAFSSSGKYTRIGRQVTAYGTVAGATSIAVGNAYAIICTTLPCSTVGDGVGIMVNSAATANGVVLNGGNVLYSGTTMAATNNLTFCITYQI